MSYPALAAMTAACWYATLRAQDGPDAAAWTPPAVASWLLWLFAAVWLTVVYCLAVAAVLRSVRHQVGRPRPGSWSRPVPSGQLEWAEERPYRQAAAEWTGSDWRGDEGDGFVSPYLDADAVAAARQGRHAAATLRYTAADLAEAQHASDVAA